MIVYKLSLLTMYLVPVLCSCNRTKRSVPQVYSPTDIDYFHVHYPDNRIGKPGSRFPWYKRTHEQVFSLKEQVCPPPFMMPYYQRYGNIDPYGKDPIDTQPLYPSQGYDSSSYNHPLNDVYRHQHSTNIQKYPPFSTQIPPPETQYPSNYNRYNPNSHYPNHRNPYDPHRYNNQQYNDMNSGANINIEVDTNNRNDAYNNINDSPYYNTFYEGKYNNYDQMNKYKHRPNNYNPHTPYYRKPQYGNNYYNDYQSYPTYPKIPSYYDQNYQSYQNSRLHHRQYEPNYQYPPYGNNYNTPGRYDNYFGNAIDIYQKVNPQINNYNPQTNPPVNPNYINGTVPH